MRFATGPALTIIGTWGPAVGGLLRTPDTGTSRARGNRRRSADQSLGYRSRATGDDGS